MIDLLTIGATVRPGAAPSDVLVVEARVHATAEPPPAGEVRATVTPAPGLAEQLRPRSATQEVLVRVLVEGLPGRGTVTLWGQDLTAWSMEETLTRGASWSVALPASLADWTPGPLRYELDWLAPPPGLVPVHLELVYRTTADQELHVYRLISDGITTRSRRELGRELVHVQELSGLGPAGRWDRVQVSYTLPPGHGRSHGEIIRGLALAAGMPQELIGVGAEIGVPRTSPLEVACQEWLPVARQVAEAAGYALLWDRDGLLVVRELVPSGPPEITFTIEDLVASGGTLSADANGEVPTCVVVRGRRVELDDGVAAGGAVTTETEVETIGPFAVPGAFWQQNAAVLTAMNPGGPLPEKKLTTRRVVTRRTTVRGCLASEEIITYAWAAPEAARYVLDAEGGVTGRISWIYDAGATHGDQSPGYAWPRQRFSEVSRVRRVPTWGTGAGGPLTLRKVFHGAWLNPPEAVKERTLSTIPWEEVPYRANVKVTGSRQGVAFETAAYFLGPSEPRPSTGGIAVDPSTNTSPFWAQSETTSFESTDGFLRGEKYVKRAWAKSGRGGRFLYADGTGADHDVVRGVDVETVVTVYQATGEASHRAIETRTDQHGELVEDGLTISEREGYLPAVETCDEETRLRTSNRKVEAKVCAPGLRASHPGNTETVSNDFIQTDAEAADMAQRKLVRDSALDVTIQILPNAAVYAGMVVEVHVPEAGFVRRRGWVEDVGTSVQGDPARSRVLSEVLVKVPLVEE